jgi:UDP-2-acetamido-3-amino-2,3-dideoxy-glucuronate N-acetyltransferase
MSSTEVRGSMGQDKFSVHPTAVVEDGSVIGEGTSVWHHCHIRSGATIAASCVLGKNVFVDSGAVIGNRVKIQNNVSVYSGVTVEDDVFVGPSAVFTNDRVPRAFNLKWEITPTLIMRGASIGANATIVCGNNVGSYAMVAAGATVTKPVRDHELVGGLPAKTLGWVCKCGVVVSRDAEPPTEVDLVCSSCKERVS